MKRTACIGRALAIRSLLVVASSTLLLAQAGADDRFYLVGGRLHVGNGSVVEDAVIEVSGDRITAVGGPEGAVPEGSTVIDVTGRELTPGLIAGASQLGLVEIAAEPSTRDTVRERGGLIRAGYDPAPAVNALSSLIRVQAIEGITSAAVSPLGALLSGQVAFVDLVHGDYAGMVVARRIAQRGALESQFDGSRAAALTQLRRAFVDARFLAANRDDYDEGDVRELVAPAHDLSALDPVLDGRVPLIMWADRAGDILALIDLAREFDVRLVIEGGAEAWLIADALARAEVPVLLTPSLNLPQQLDALGARLDAASRLAEAGVAIGIIEAGGAHNVRNIRQEAGIAVANGLDWETALRSITLQMAEIYGVAEDRGSVEAGKVANLVVWDADPFELSSAALRVFIRGREIPLVSRQTRLRDRYLDLSGRKP